MEDVFQEDVILAFLTSFMRDSCRKYALSKMNKDDYILLNDVYEVYPRKNTVIMQGREKQLMTIKRSSKEKYNTAYEKKLIKIIGKMIK